MLLARGASGVAGWYNRRGVTVLGGSAMSREREGLEGANRGIRRRGRMG